MLDHEVFIHPLAIPDARTRTLFERLIARTAALEDEPRFYDTPHATCTNGLAKAAGLRRRLSFVFTGASDEHLFRRGVIPGASFEAARARADVAALISTLRAAGEDIDFDAALLAERRAAGPDRPRRATARAASRACARPGTL